MATVFFCAFQAGQDQPSRLGYNAPVFKTSTVHRFKSISTSDTIWRRMSYRKHTPSNPPTFDTHQKPSIRYHMHPEETLRHPDSKRPNATGICTPHHSPHHSPHPRAPAPRPARSNLRVRRSEAASTRTQISRLRPPQSTRPPKTRTRIKNQASDVSPLHEA